MAITSLSLMQDNKNPNKIWLYFIDAGSGEPSQYLLDKDEFSKLQNAGVQVSRTVNDPLYYLKGNLPSFDFLLKKAKQPLPQGFGDERQKTELQSTVSMLNKVFDTPQRQMTPEERASKTNAFIAQHQRANTPYIEVPSELVDGDYVVANGVFQTKQAYEKSNQLKQLVASGQMKNIGTPERPLYVPIGSAADILNSQKQGGKLQQQQSFKNTKIQDALNTVPDKKANRQFVDALFQEREGRKATESEWKMIEGRTVSDATGFVLGAGTTSDTGVGTTGQQGGEQISPEAQRYIDSHPGETYADVPSIFKGQDNKTESSLKPQSAEQIAQSTRDFLKSIGVSDDLINSVSPRDLNVLAMMNQVMQKKAENDEKLAPKNLTLEEINKYLEDAEVDAKKELDPYYQEQFDFAKQDLLQNIAFQTGQLQDLEAMQATQFQQQQEQLGGQMAESGLAQSGIRLEAEKRLREQQQGIVRSQRRQLGQNIYGVGSEFERTFGSQKAASLYPTLTSQAQAGLPEQQLGYSPLGGRKGTMAKEQTVATRQERDRLALIEMQKRQLLARQ